jgi:hypothetical protein
MYKAGGEIGRPLFYTQVGAPVWTALGSFQDRGQSIQHKNVDPRIDGGVGKHARSDRPRAPGEQSEDQG